MTSWRYAVSTTGGAGGADVRRRAVADRDTPAAHLLEHGVDERGLDLERGSPSGSCALNALTGFEDGVAGGALVEEVEVEVVAVDVRDAALEQIADPRVGVLADREQEVRPQVASD